MHQICLWYKYIKDNGRQFAKVFGMMLHHSNIQLIGEICFIYYQSSQSTMGKNPTNLKTPSLQSYPLATVGSSYISAPDSLQRDSSELHACEDNCSPCLVGLSWRWVWKDKVWIGYF